MSELPPPPGNTAGLTEPSPLLFSSLAPKEPVLERVPEEEEKEEDINHEKSSSGNIKNTSGGLFHEKTSDHFHEYDNRDRRRRCPSCFGKCCAGTCLLVSIVLLIVLFVGLSLSSSINSSLPEVFVANLDLQTMNFSRSSAELLLNADVITVLQLSNKKDKNVLDYSPMTADVSSENIKLGQTKIQGFRQNPNEVKTLKISTRVRKSSVYEIDAILLRNSLKNFEAIVDVFLSGKMGMNFWGQKIHIPIVIACEKVKQNDVIQGLKPKCDVRVFAQR